MDQIYAMIKLFGERYIFCDDTQALLDAVDREDMVAAFAAIMEFMRMKRNE